MYITFNISKETANPCFEFLEQLLHTLAIHTLERRIAILQEAIRKRKSLTATLKPDPFQDGCTGSHGPLRRTGTVIFDSHDSSKPAAHGAGRAVRHNVDRQETAHKSTRLAVEVLSE
ncbi:hypothetical protein HPB51_026401 [Rhipicephalus microplus]|uniref:Uncharacterized protein n=1 Tax=Rhipicephalus microplus TaxID=6941 RepID=A0A9J6D371_RHIMP|nr:hypothetical protein HPB51_026401 [Rhipicephalus microplus]